MKSVSYFLLTTLALTVLVLGAVYDQSEQRLEKRSPEKTGMSQDWAKYIIGAKNKDGVASIVYLNPAQNHAAEHNSNQSHHIMVVFGKIGTGDFVENAAVEIKLVAPNGNIENTDVLFAMDGGFGTNINLSQQGTYRLEIRAALPDGKVRIFKHSFVKNMHDLMS